MREIKLYTLEDAREDMKSGIRDPEIAKRKWRSIIEALAEIEMAASQATSFCMRYQELGCSGCPVLKYDYPCGHPLSTYMIFMQDLRRLRTLAERMFSIILRIDEEDLESRKSVV